MRILSVSTADLGGGAERVAWMLFEAYAQRGHESWLAVGYRRRKPHPRVVRIPNPAPTHPWVRLALRWSGWGDPEQRPPPRWARLMAEPLRYLNLLRGREDIVHPGTRWLLRRIPDPVDVIHCHNLHGGYFDLGQLPLWSARHAVVLTLHDSWLLTGHCAHSFDCERWRTGCGRCPDLSIYPAIRRDQTAFNWRRKRAVFRRSRLFVSTASQWMMDRVRRSMLGPCAIETRVIPWGVEREIFHPGDRRAARERVGLPANARILLMVAKRARTNPWKDFPSLRAALHLWAPQGPVPVLLVLLGQEAAEEHIGPVKVLSLDLELPEMADYYRAADITVHPARAEAFGLAVVESLVCGTPVVATAVGGTPELVRSLEATRPHAAVDVSRATGILTPPGDPHALARALKLLSENDELRLRLGRNAAEDARRRFDAERMIDEYVAWLEEILERGRQVESVNRQTGTPMATSSPGVSALRTISNKMAHRGP